MAKCSLCGREKSLSQSCLKHFIRIDGVFYEALPYKPRNKTLYEIHNNVKKRCPHCGVIEGGYHHVGCIFEVCPKCLRFWLSCNCFGIKTLKSNEEPKVVFLENFRNK
ncbi:MAG: hypothetical protein H6680_09265 [Desulfobacteraceae bacterium]|nr:hypothetical protein [Desulfobacteraceae bacterium]